MPLSHFVSYLNEEIDKIWCCFHSVAVVLVSHIGVIQKNKTRSITYMSNGTIQRIVAQNSQGK